MLVYDLEIEIERAFGRINPISLLPSQRAVLHLFLEKTQSFCFHKVVTLEGVEKAKPDRWLFFLIITIALFLASAILFPTFVTDGFSWQALLSSVGPVIWGFSLFFLYRTKNERRVCWFSAVPALLWLIPTIMEIGTAVIH